MNRKDFLGQMLHAIFTIKTLEYQGTSKNTVIYMVGGTLLRDCTYSIKYRNRIEDIILNLFEEKYTHICFERKEISPHEDIQKYQENARRFIISLLTTKKYVSESYSELFHALQNSLSLSMLKHLYQTVIIHEIFNVNSDKPSKDLGKDPFDEATKNIISDIWKYLEKNKDEVVYKNNFFDDLIKEHPILSQINFDTEEITVQEDFNSSLSIVKNTSNPVVSLYDAIETKKMLLQDNDRFSAYGDYVEMTDERFWLMGDLLATLCLNAQSYCLYLNSDEICQFVNTAVRLYNKFYGKGHTNYVGSVYREAWTTHKTFSEYLLYLDWAVKIIVSKETTKDEM